MANEIVIKCDNVPRSVVCWHDLSKKERADFDYIPEEDRWSQHLVRYKGVVYDLNEFMRVPEVPQFNGLPALGMQRFDGYQSDSFFSGVLCKYPDPSSCELVIMATYYA